jgi:hypothetical protein
MASIPCVNLACPYAKYLKNGFCEIKVRFGYDKNTDTMRIAIIASKDDELKRKMDCFEEHIYRETGYEGQRDPKIYYENVDEDD